MNSILPPDTIFLVEAAALVPGRRGKIGVSTLFRWAQKGVRGVRLRTVCVGGRRATTRQWLAEFLAATNGEPAPTNPAAADDAERQLHALGA